MGSSDFSDHTPADFAKEQLPRESSLEVSGRLKGTSRKIHDHIRLGEKSHKERDSASSNDDEEI